MLIAELDKIDYEKEAEKLEAVLAVKGNSFTIMELARKLNREQFLAVHLSPLTRIKDLDVNNAIWLAYLLRRKR